METVDLSKLGHVEGNAQEAGEGIIEIIVPG